MNTVVKRKVKPKAPRAKATSTYLTQEEEADLDFVIACNMEKLKLSSNGDDFEPITKSEMLRILVAKESEALKAEGWSPEQLDLALENK
jgi:hypothetical protein